MAAFMFDLWKSKNECGIFFLFFFFDVAKSVFLIFLIPPLNFSVSFFYKQHKFRSEIKPFFS